MAQATLQRELEDFQERLQRCTMVCQDQAREKYCLDGSESGAKVTAAQGFITECSSKCVDEHLSMLEYMRAKIEGEIGKHER